MFMMIMQCVKEVVLQQQTKGNFHLDWQVQAGLKWHIESRPKSFYRA